MKDAELKGEETNSAKCQGKGASTWNLADVRRDYKEQTTHRSIKTEVNSNPEHPKPTGFKDIDNCVNDYNSIDGQLHVDEGSSTETKTIFLCQDT